MVTLGSRDHIQPGGGDGANRSNCKNQNRSRSYIRPKGGDGAGWDHMTAQGTKMTHILWDGMGLDDATKQRDKDDIHPVH